MYIVIVFGVHNILVINIFMYKLVLSLEEQLPIYYFTLETLSSLWLQINHYGRLCIERGLICIKNQPNKR